MAESVIKTSMNVPTQISSNWDYSSNTAPSNYTAKHNGFLAISCISIGDANALYYINNINIFTNYPYVLNVGSNARITHSVLIPVHAGDIFKANISNGTLTEWRIKEIY